VAAWRRRRRRRYGESYSERCSEALDSAYVLRAWRRRRRYGELYRSDSDDALGWVVVCWGQKWIAGGGVMVNRTATTLWIVRRAADRVGVLLQVLGKARAVASGDEVHGAAVQPLDALVYLAPVGLERRAI